MRRNESLIRIVENYALAVQLLGHDSEGLACDNYHLAFKILQRIIQIGRNIPSDDAHLVRPVMRALGSSKKLPFENAHYLFGEALKAEESLPLYYLPGKTPEELERHVKESLILSFLFSIDSTYPNFLMMKEERMPKGELDDLL